MLSTMEGGSPPRVLTLREHDLDVTGTFCTIRRPMGTAKRERQKQGRQARIAQAQAAAVKKKRMRNAVLLGVLVVVLVGASLAIGAGGGDDDDVTATATTAADTSAPGETPATITVTIPPQGEAITGETPCPEADGSSPRTTSFEQPPSGCLDEGSTYSATIATTMGDITVELDQAAAPETVNSFVSLARYHYYDGVAFHRIIPGFMIQGGDAVGPSPGTGGPGYTLPDELPPADGDPLENYAPGVLAMANSGPNTSGSQFFIMATGNTGLGADYSVFGHVTAGQDVVDAIDQLGDGASNGTPTAEVIITSVTITES
jgi:cyclophilin family peptidyl-prolyl cis-trans isomerase